MRGVYPAMLPDRGPRAALEELAAMLPRPVRFRGDLGPRVGWQVESGLYHAVAAVLNVLAGRKAGEPVTVAFRRDDALRVRLIDARRTRCRCASCARRSATTPSGSPCSAAPWSARRAAARPW